MIRKFFRWILKAEIEELNFQTTMTKEATERCKKLEETLRITLSNIDVSVDVEEYKYASSWAVISLQGEKSDYLKFVELGKAEIDHIKQFLRQFERNSNIKIDASPKASHFLKHTGGRQKHYL